MSKINSIKIIKIVVGCILALIIAQGLQLNYNTSVVTITLLSIRNTKKDTLLTAIRKMSAFFISVTVIFISFSLLGFTNLSLAVYLLLFVLACQFFKLDEGIAMNVVLVLHIWSQQSLSLAVIFNEFVLVSIGIVMGFLVNIYMPDQINSIIKDQRKIEDNIRQILKDMSCTIMNEKPEQDIDNNFDKLKTALQAALKRAEDIKNNNFFGDMSYYLQYIQMRRFQYDILLRIKSDISRLNYVPYQAKIVSEYFIYVSESLHEYNSAGELLEEFTQMRKRFKKLNLPISRDEFEARAILFEIVNDMKHLLLLKKNFTENLSDYQIKTFWKKQ